MSFGEIEQFSSALNFLVMIPYVAISVLFPFGLIYILGFLRGRDGNKDPLLGAKVVSCLLLTLSLHILPMYATAITYGAGHILCMIPMFHDWSRVKGDGEDSLLITKQDLSAQAADTDVETPVVPGSDP